MIINFLPVSPNPLYSCTLVKLIILATCHGSKRMHTAGMLNLCLRNLDKAQFLVIFAKFSLPSTTLYYNVNREKEKHDLLQNWYSIDSLAGGSTLSAIQLYRPSALLFTLRITI